MKIEKTQNLGFLGTLALASASFPFFAGCSQNTPGPARSIDNVSSFTVQEDLISIGTDMTISDSEGALGTVEQNNFSWGTSFTFSNNTGEVLATAKQKVKIMPGTEIEIFDAEGTKLGMFKEEVFKNMFSFKSHFIIYDANGTEIGKSEKSDFFGTTVIINNNSGEMVAKISRPAFDLGAATWTVETPGDIDKRLIIFIASYKTLADNSKE